MTDFFSIKKFTENTGLHVFETYTVNLEQCSCKAGANCKSPGKHPREKNWQKVAKPCAEATRLMENVRSGRCNYGLVTTGQDFVLDFDGEVGCKTFGYLASVLPKLQKAPRVKTQGGGLHVYVRHRQGEEFSIQNKAKLLPGMDVRGQGGFVVGPGSVGLSGKYAIEHLEDFVPELSESELGCLFLHPQLPGLPKRHKEPRIEGTRNDLTFKALCAMRAFGVTDDQMHWIALGVNAFNMPPLDVDELKKGVESAIRYEKGSSTNRKGAARQSCFGQDDGEISAVEDFAGSDEVLPRVVDKLRSPEWAGSIQLDEFSDEVVIASQNLDALGTSHDSSQPKKLNDFDIAFLRDLFTRELGDSVSADTLFTAINVVASENRFHPVRAYLRSLSWDSKPRVEMFFVNYFGAERGEYSSLVAKCFLVSLVARVMRPGCQVDTVPILEGAQGIGKSKGLRALGREYFGDPSLDLTNKDAFQQIHGLWIIEFAELETLRRRGAATAKAFITTRVDRYRPPYGRVVKDQPRQCVFVGTTNETHYLHDTTGNRRFLPIKVTRADVEAIEADRDQIFAEAMAMYESGVVWWPEGKEVALAGQEQSSRVETDPWEDTLAELLNCEHSKFDEISAVEVFRALGIPENYKDKDKQTRVGQIMRNLGWHRKRGRKHGTNYIRDQRHLDSTYHLHHLNPTSSQILHTVGIPWDAATQSISVGARGCKDEVAQVVQVVTSQSILPVCDDTQSCTDVDGGAQ